MTALPGPARPGAERNPRRSEPCSKTLSSARCWAPPWPPAGSGPRCTPRTACPTTSGSRTGGSRSWSPAATAAPGSGWSRARPPRMPTPTGSTPRPCWRRPGWPPPPSASRPRPRSATCAAASPRCATRWRSTRPASRTTLAELVRRADDAARGYDPAVAQVTAGYGDVRQQVMIANSDGFSTLEDRVRTRLVVQVVAVRDGVVQTGFDGPGRSMGFELLDEFPPEEVARRAAERAVAMLDSKPAPAGQMPVVIASGNGGVLFHESSGHGMEADLIAKEASVYTGKQGKRIGDERFNGVDDATIEGAWGSFAFDDEGTPAQRTVLFEAGICTDYLTDLIRARQLKLPASGNGRRQSYAEVPIPRMTNTYVLPGGDDPSEIIRQTPRGLYAKSLGGGQVNPVTGEFVFGVV